MLNFAGQELPSQIQLFCGAHMW